MKARELARYYGDCMRQAEKPYRLHKQLLRDDGIDGNFNKAYRTAERFVVESNKLSLLLARLERVADRVEKDTLRRLKMLAAIQRPQFSAVDMNLERDFDLFSRRMAQTKRALVLMDVAEKKGDDKALAEVANQADLVVFHADRATKIVNGMIGKVKGYRKDLKSWL